MLDNTLSVCMIVKNEEKCLEKCLESIKTIADEIIIVDTGSSDNTINIAKKFGANIILHEWKHDFSDARNKSLEYATKNWILFIDADECLPAEEGLKLKNILMCNSNLEAFHLRLVNIISNVDAGDAVVLRVFKNNPKYRFRGKMHEQIVTSIEELTGLNYIGSTDIKILHYGYDPEVYDIGQKQKRNMELLNSYPEDERDGYFYYSLGNEYARIFEYEKALQMYSKADEFYRKADKKPVYSSYLHLNILKILSFCGRYNEEIKKIEEYKIIYKNFRELYFMEFLVYMECKCFSKAKKSLLNYLSCPSGNYEYPCNSFDKQYNLEEILENLENNIVENEDDLISVLIMVDEDDPTLIDTIKSINEIAYEIIIVTQSKLNLDKNKYENIGARVIEVKYKDRSKIFLSGHKECGGKYTLLIKPKEVISIESEKSLVESLKSSTNEFFNLIVIDNINNISSSEFRLFKNNKNFDEFSNFEEYINYIDLQPQEDLPTCIYKIY